MGEGWIAKFSMGELVSLEGGVDFRLCFRPSSQSYWSFKYSFLTNVGGQLLNLGWSYNPFNEKKSKLVGADLRL